VRQIFEKCHEYIHNIFVDYTQAFHSVTRDMILACPKQYEVPPKIIKLIAMTLINNRVNIKKKEQFQ
jgi:hypothetical protein